MNTKIWYGEKLLQTYFKALYDVDFTLHRKPEWLVTKDFVQLEFDGYSPAHQIAIEHNGATHYEFTPAFHKTRADFIRQVQNDRRKKYLCTKNNVHLIIIPKLYTHNPPVKLPLLVKRAYDRKKLALPLNYHNVIVRADGTVWKTKRVLFQRKLVQVT